MWIDIIFLIIAILGFWGGWKHGLIITIFSVLGWLLGITGALKLSEVAAVALRDHLDLQSRWTPVIAFILVFIIIALIVYMIGKSLEKVIEIVQLGFINRILGALLRLFLFAFIYSLFIWLIYQAGMISPEVKTESKTFKHLLWFADHSIRFLGDHLAVVKDIFTDIQNFFETLPESDLP